MTKGTVAKGLSPSSGVPLAHHAGKYDRVVVLLQVSGR
jgi:hypothetical protein